MKIYGYWVVPAVLCSAFHVGAQAAEDEKEKADPKWGGEANLAYVNSEGNTQSTNLDFRGKAERKSSLWNSLLKLEASNETVDREEGSGIDRVAEEYFASGKGEYNLSEKSYLYGLLEYTVDKFSGYNYDAVLTAGIGRNFLDTDTQELSGDIGVGYRQSELEDPELLEEDAVLRLAATYKWKISDSATFEEEFSTELGELKNVTKSFTRLRLKINGSLSASFAYEIEHVSDVPPDVKNSDRKTLVGLVYEF